MDRVREVPVLRTETVYARCKAGLDERVKRLSEEYGEPTRVPRDVQEDGVMEACLEWDARGRRDPMPEQGWEIKCKEWPEGSRSSLAEIDGWEPFAISLSEDRKTHLVWFRKPLNHLADVSGFRVPL